MQKIFEGEFYPSEAVVSGDPDYVTKEYQVGEEIEYIASRLIADDKVRFDKLMDLMGEMEHMNGYANYAYGFRTGILLMFKLFASENKHPFTEHK